MGSLMVPPTRSAVYATDSVLDFMRMDTEGDGRFSFKAERERMHRQAALVTAYATADPVLMFDPSLHDVALKSGGEMEGDYRARVKYARTLTSRVLDSRIQGCAALPVTFTPSAGIDLDPLTTRLNLERIQTVAECTSTAAVRPVWDYSTGSVFYQTFGAHELTPYLGPADDLLVGLAVEGDGYRELWTEASFVIMQGGEVVAEGPNPWGEIPFSVFRVRRHPRLWWGVSDLAVVTLNNIAINKLWSDLLQLAAEQSFAIYVVYENENTPPAYTEEPGDAPARRADFNWTSGKTVYVPNNGKVETISPDADIKAIGDVVETMGQRTLDDAYLIDIGQSQAGQSGFSLRVRFQPYLNKMAATRKEFTRGLEHLLQLAALVEFAGTTGSAFVRRRPEFRVLAQFDASALTPTPMDETVRRYEFEHRIGASSAVDYVKETQGLTVEDATTRVRKVVADTAAGLNGPGPAAETPAQARTT